MSYKTLLAILDSVEALDAQTAQAMAIAERFGAHLIGYHAEAIGAPVATIDGFADQQFIIAETERAQSRSNRIEERFNTLTKTAGASANFAKLESGLVGDPSVAHSADLVLAFQPVAGSPEASSDIEQVLRQSGRPLLLLPGDAKSAFAASNILIAWNSSRESARAVFDALPLLKSAASVSILVVTDGADDNSTGERILASLERHGVKPTLVRRPRDSQSIEGVIVNYADEIGADLLVAGAYGKSWLGALFMGDVTNDLIGKSKIALFASH